MASSALLFRTVSIRFVHFVCTHPLFTLLLSSLRQQLEANNQPAGAQLWLSAFGHSTVASHHPPYSFPSRHHHHRILPFSASPFVTTRFNARPFHARCQHARGTTNVINVASPSPTTVASTTFGGASMAAACFDHTDTDTYAYSSPMSEEQRPIRDDATRPKRSNEQTGSDGDETR